MTKMNLALSCKAKFIENILKNQKQKICGHTVGELEPARKLHF